ncbi:hypothetical protein [Streptomyces sp. NPDC015131]|uniref:hypothetical protein n=1 Tax=Streptomyces sp. NPDC015131 TaxID=3364941 RepID=UPI0036FC688F
MRLSRAIGASLRLAEGIIVQRYPGLVRLAYLVLPDTLDRHHRVLAAHRAVQRSLRPAGRAAAGGADPTVAVFAEVVRQAARGSRSPLLPRVYGLRVWPADERLDDTARTLAELPPSARAAYALCRLEGLPAETAEDVLARAGTTDAAAAVRAASRVVPEGTDQQGALSDTAAIFHGATLSSRPTDLIRRRGRIRAAVAAGALLLLALPAGHLLRATPGDGTGSTIAGRSGPPAAEAAAARLVRVDGQAWSDTGRVDFTVWPARGGRTTDRALLTRALASWADPASRDTTVTTAPATSDAPPQGRPHLLYAGTLGTGDTTGAAPTVVVLLDGDRLARYTESTGDGRSRLDLARVDDAGVTTAAAVTLARSPDGTARHLLAPWIATAARRDLAVPGTPADPVRVGADGTVTTSVPRRGTPPPDGATAGTCAAPPVLEVASSARIVEKHSFLIADLGGLLPAHLTYTPLPGGAGVPHARQPREATGTTALARWAKGTCLLDKVPEGAVRAVNLWDFATGTLPENGGRAVWSCTRLTRWTGQGDIQVTLQPPSGRPVPVVDVRATAACGRFGQHILAGTVWRTPSGQRYHLAAGSRHVTAITVAGPAAGDDGGEGAAGRTRPGRTLSVPLPPGAAPAPLTARLSSGASLRALDGERGGRD